MAALKQRLCSNFKGFDGGGQTGLGFPHSEFRESYFKPSQRKQCQVSQSGRDPPGASVFILTPRFDQLLGEMKEVFSEMHVALLILIASSSIRNSGSFPPQQPNSRQKVEESSNHEQRLHAEYQRCIFKQAS